MLAPLRGLLALGGLRGALVAVLVALTMASTATAEPVVPSTPADPFVDALPSTFFQSGSLYPNPDEDQTNRSDCLDFSASTALRVECYATARYRRSDLAASRAIAESIELATRRLGLIAARQSEPVALDDDTIEALSGAPAGTTPTNTTVSLSEGSIEALADAIAEQASGGGEPLPDDPLSDPRFRMLFGLMVGLWVMTRIYRQVIPGG